MMGFHGECFVFFPLFGRFFADQAIFLFVACLHLKLDVADFVCPCELVAREAESIGSGVFGLTVSIGSASAGGTVPIGRSASGLAVSIGHPAACVVGVDIPNWRHVAGCRIVGLSVAFRRSAAGLSVAFRRSAAGLSVLFGFAVSVHFAHRIGFYANQRQV